MDTFDVSNLIGGSMSDDELASRLGIDVLGLFGSTDSQEEMDEVEEDDIDEPVVKIKYSDARKKKLLDRFRITYVNDYGRKDPYHSDTNDEFVSEVKSEVRAIYGNKSLVRYIIAMRKILRMYGDMYHKSPQRLVMDFPSFVELIVAGDIPSPINHPLVRTNVPTEILLKYITNEKLDPEDITRFTTVGPTQTDSNVITINLGNAEDDWNTPIEYDITPVKIQKRIIQSWLGGKPKRKGLDKNEAIMVYGLTSHYDQKEHSDLLEFSFNDPISYHPDIISRENVMRSFSDHIGLGGYTEKDMEMHRRGAVIRSIMNADPNELDVVTISGLIGRMERKAADTPYPVSGLGMLNTLHLFGMGVTAVRFDKLGREIYEYGGKKKIRINSMKEYIQNIEEKAKEFNEITRDLYERFRSVPYSDLIDEIKKENEIIAKYGLEYYLNN